VEKAAPLLKHRRETSTTKDRSSITFQFAYFTNISHFNATNSSLPVVMMEKLKTNCSDAKQAAYFFVYLNSNLPNFRKIK
jgi:hypothetical protein